MRTTIGSSDLSGPGMTLTFFFKVTDTGKPECNTLFMFGLDTRLDRVVVGDRSNYQPLLHHLAFASILWGYRIPRRNLDGR